jgi:putative ABC transport system substrate-binding protein
LQQYLPIGDLSRCSNYVGDPIGSGFVASFPRPGGNITGFNLSEPTQAGKWVELLKEVAPRIARVAILFNPASATYAEYWLKPFKAAAAAFAVEAIVVPVRDGGCSAWPRGKGP